MWLLITCIMLWWDGGCLLLGSYSPPPSLLPGQITTEAGQDTGSTSGEFTSGQDTESTTVPSNPGQDSTITGIIGFAAVLVILVVAVLAVLLLCTCSGYCRVHSQSVQNRMSVTPNATGRRSFLPSPMPSRDPILPVLNATRSQNSPYCVARNASTPPTSTGNSQSPRVAHIPRMAPCDSHLHNSSSRQTTACYITTHHLANGAAPMQLHPLAGPGSVETQGVAQHTDSPVNKQASRAIGEGYIWFSGDMSNSQSSDVTVIPKLYSTEV